MNMNAEKRKRKLKAPAAVLNDGKPFDVDGMNPLASIRKPVVKKSTLSALSRSNMNRSHQSKNKTIRLLTAANKCKAIPQLIPNDHTSNVIVVTQRCPKPAKLPKNPDSDFEFMEPQLPRHRRRSSSSSYASINSVNSNKSNEKQLVASPTFQTPHLPNDTNKLRRKRKFHQIAEDDVPMSTEDMTSPAGATAGADLRTPVPPGSVQKKRRINSSVSKNFKNKRQRTPNVATVDNCNSVLRSVNCKRSTMKELLNRRYYDSENSSVTPPSLPPLSNTNFGPLPIVTPQARKRYTNNAMDETDDTQDLNVTDAMNVDDKTDDDDDNDDNINDSDGSDISQPQSATKLIHRSLSKSSTDMTPFLTKPPVVVFQTPSQHPTPKATNRMALDFSTPSAFPFTLENVSISPPQPIKLVTEPITPPSPKKIDSPKEVPKRRKLSTTRASFPTNNGLQSTNRLLMAKLSNTDKNKENTIQYNQHSTENMTVTAKADQHTKNLFSGDTLQQTRKKRQSLSSKSVTLRDTKTERIAMNSLGFAPHLPGFTPANPPKKAKPKLKSRLTTQAQTQPQTQAQTQTQSMCDDDMASVTSVASVTSTSSTTMPGSGVSAECPLLSNLARDSSRNAFIAQIGEHCLSRVPYNNRATRKLDEFLSIISRAEILLSNEERTRMDQIAQFKSTLPSTNDVSHLWSDDYTAQKSVRKSRSKTYTNNTIQSMLPPPTPSTTAILQKRSKKIKKRVRFCCYDLSTVTTPLYGELNSKRHSERVARLMIHAGKIGSKLFSVKSDRSQARMAINVFIDNLKEYISALNIDNRNSSIKNGAALNLLNEFSRANDESDELCYPFQQRLVRLLSSLIRFELKTIFNAREFLDPKPTPTPTVPSSTNSKKSKQSSLIVATPSTNDINRITIPQWYDRVGTFTVLEDVTPASTTPSSPQTDNATKANPTVQSPTHQLAATAEFLPYHAAEITLQLNAFFEAGKYLKRKKKSLNRDLVLTELGIDDDPSLFFSEMALVVNEFPSVLIGGMPASMGVNGSGNSKKKNRKKSNRRSANNDKFERYLMQRWKQLKSYIKEIKTTQSIDLYFYLPLLDFPNFLAKIEKENRLEFQSQMTMSANQ